MHIRPPLRTLSLSVALAACASLPALAAENVWISLGDAALAELQAAGLSPHSPPRSSHTVRVAPRLLASGQLDATAPRKLRAEQVHLVQIDEAALPTLSGALHDKLKRCGGYLFHASEAEGLAALRQQATGLAPSRIAASRPSYQITQQSVVTPLLNQMQAPNIAQTILDLSNNFTNRYYQTNTGASASDWLKTRWTALAAGRSDITVEQFSHPSWKQKSVILTVQGTDNASEIVVLGGHLDSILQGASHSDTTRAPGADDDASGIASLTEIIRTLVANSYKPRRTLKFMAYAAEEVGLRGSADIAKSFASAGRNVVGVVQLDMTNYKGSPNDIYLYTDYTDSAQNNFLRSLIQTYLPTLKIGTDVCGYACSDHASWTAQGYPTSMPFEAAFNQDNPYIHTANDTFANSGNTAEHSLKFARMALAYAVELGSEGPGTPPPADKVESFKGSLALNQTQSFGPFKVAAGGSFKASTTGTGDIDLYARRGSLPSPTLNDCKSEGSTSTESCTLSLSANGDAYVLLKGYAAGSYTLTVSYRPQALAPAAMAARHLPLPR